MPKVVQVKKNFTKIKSGDGESLTSELRMKAEKKINKTKENVICMCAMFRFGLSSHHTFTCVGIKTVERKSLSLV